MFSKGVGDSGTMLRRPYQPQSGGPLWRVLGLLLCLVLIGVAVWLVFLLRQPERPVPAKPAVARQLPSPPRVADTACVESPVARETQPAPAPPEPVRLHGPVWDHLSDGLRRPAARRIVFQAGRLNGFPGPEQAEALTDEFECVTPTENVTHVRADGQWLGAPASAPYADRSRADVERSGRPACADTADKAPKREPRSGTDPRDPAAVPEVPRHCGGRAMPLSAFPQRLEPGQAVVVHLDGAARQDLLVRWHGFADDGTGRRGDTPGVPGVRLPGALRVEGNGRVLWHRCVRSAPTRGAAWFPAAYSEPGETTVAVTNTGSVPFVFDAFWIEAGTESGAPPPSPRREGPLALPGPIPMFASGTAPAFDAGAVPDAEAVRRRAAEGEGQSAGGAVGARLEPVSDSGVAPDRVNAGLRTQETAGATMALEVASSVSTDSSLAVSSQPAGTRALQPDGPRGTCDSELRVYVRERTDVPAAYQALLTEMPAGGDAELAECCSVLDPDLLQANLAGEYAAGLAKPEPFEFAPASLWALYGHHAGYWDRRAKTSLHLLEYVAAFYHGGGRTLVLDGLTAAGGVFSPWDGKPFAPWYPLRELLRVFETGTEEVRFNVVPTETDRPPLDEVCWFGTRGENVCTLALVGNARIRGERRVRIVTPVPWQGKTRVKESLALSDVLEQSFSVRFSSDAKMSEAEALEILRHRVRSRFRGG
ncbi:MAG: hypothetical protein A3K18_02755 [Lentisphaerae bacterium RIFOXYA12_64_32]|nr:MAG: hypothetical protein A3K18_02755 [Lentisphaerae bacterium RIFOXYA12_64_32]